MKKLHIGRLVILIIATLAMAFITMVTASIAQARPRNDTPAGLTTTAVYNATRAVKTATQMANIAYHKSVTTSSVPCVDIEGPDKLVTGLNIPDEWCTKSTNKVVIIDLQQKYLITSITVYHAAMANDSQIYNTRDFSIWISPDSSTYSVIASVTGNTSNMSVFNINSTTPARFVKLFITQGAQPGQQNIARINDVIVQGVPVFP